jgi:hypothetical protein
VLQASDKDVAHFFLSNNGQTITVEFSSAEPIPAIAFSPLCLLK